MSETYRVSLQDGQTYELNADDIEGMKVHRSGECLLIWLDGIRYVTEPKQLDDKRYEVRIEGITFQLEIRDELDQKIKEMGLADEISSGVGDILAPMPGLVLQTLVEEGEIVEEGQAIIILEAMKMENVIKAPADGTITGIEVKEGETVDKNAVLFTLE